MSDGNNYDYKNMPNRGSGEVGRNKPIGAIGDGLNFLAKNTDELNTLMMALC